MFPEWNFIRHIESLRTQQFQTIISSFHIYLLNSHQYILSYADKRIVCLFESDWRWRMISFLSSLYIKGCSKAGFSFKIVRCCLQQPDFFTELIPLLLCWRRLEVEDKKVFVGSSAQMNPYRLAEFHRNDRSILSFCLVSENSSSSGEA